MDLNSWMKMEGERINKMNAAFEKFDFGTAKLLNHTTDWLNKSGVPIYYRTVFIEKNGVKATANLVVRFAHLDSVDVEEILLTE